MTEERRRAPRLKPEKNISAKIRAYHPARILDISTTGTLLAATFPFNPGNTCDLRIDTGSEEVLVRGTVRRSWLKGFDKDPDGKRVTLYHVAVMFNEPAPHLLECLPVGKSSDIQVGIEGDDSE
jgi:hypothetical protein